MTSANPADPWPDQEPGLLWRTLSRHWVGLLTVWLLGTLAAEVLIYSQLKPIYRSSSRLRCEPPSLCCKLFGSQNSPDGEPVVPWLQTQIEQITSPDVLKAATTNPKVAAIHRFRNSIDPTQELRKVIQVERIPGSFLLEVSMTSSDATEPSIVVNAVVDSLLIRNAERYDSLTRNLIMSLEQYLRDLYAQSDELERQWKEIVANGNADQLLLEKQAGQNNQWKIVIEENKKVRSEILTVEFELAEVRPVLEMAKASAGEASSTTKPDQAQQRIDRMMQRKFQIDPEAMDLAEKMRLAQTKYDTVRIARNPSDPAVKDAKKNLDSLQEKYNLLWDARSSDWLEKIAMGEPGILSPDQEIRELTNKVDRLAAKRTALKKVVSELELNRRRPRTDSERIQLILDHRATVKAMQEKVQRRLEQYRSQCRSEIRVRKVSEAVVSNKPVQNLRPLLMSLSPYAVFFATFALFLVVEARTGPRSRPVVVEPAKPDPTPEV
jgi:hypothetical protein